MLACVYNIELSGVCVSASPSVCGDCEGYSNFKSTSDRCRELQSELSASQAREAELREKLEAAEELSVTKILLRVEPDLDGHSSEVYARSVAEVVDELGRIDEALETAEEKLRAAEARIKANQEQEPVGIATSYVEMYEGIVEGGGVLFEECIGKPPLKENQFYIYAQPPIPPELQSAVILG